NANRQATLFADDSIAAITAHPTPDGYPSPALASPADGLRTNNTTPTLSASFGDPETLDTGTTTFQYCSDSSCNSPIATSSAIASSDAAIATWAPGTLYDGTYYWRVLAEGAAEDGLRVSSTVQPKQRLVCGPITAMVY